MERKYFVYMVECSDGTYYIGKTLNIDKRLREHNGELPKGAKYTRGRRPVVLKYVEECIDANSALKREHQLKQLSKKEKTSLVNC